MPDLIQRTEEPEPSIEYGLPAVLTVQETAAFLRMNPKTVYAALLTDALPGRRVGKRIVILRDALLEWFRSDERVPPSRKRRA